MGTNINRNLPSNAYDAATLANAPSAINPYLTLNDLPTGSGTQLISGAASWSGTGMVFNVTDLVYKINGTQYTASAANVTLAAGDPTFDRFDIIVADSSGIISVVTGTPALNPLVPNAGPDEVLVQYVFVAQGATTPSVTNEFVYREGSTPDWTSAIIGTGLGTPTANFSYPGPSPAPFLGSQCLLASFNQMDWNKYIRFVPPAPISRSAYVVLSMRVYLPVNYATLDGNLNGRRPLVTLMNGNTYLGQVFLDLWGLNRTQVGTWQLVTIPISAFNLSVSLTTITSLRLYTYEYINTVPANVSIAYDDIKFQSGYGPQTNTATIDILEQFTTIGSTAKLNFITTPGINMAVTNNIATNTIDVTPTNTGVVDVSYLLGPSVVLNQSYAGQTIILDPSVTDITLPFNGTINIQVGSVFKFCTEGSASVAIIPENLSVILNSLSGLSNINAPYGVVTLTKTAANIWYAEGNLI